MSNAMDYIHAAVESGDDIQAIAEAGERIAACFAALGVSASAVGESNEYKELCVKAQSLPEGPLTDEDLEPFVAAGLFRNRPPVAPADPNAPPPAPRFTGDRLRKLLENLPALLTQLPAIINQIKPLIDLFKNLFPAAPVA